MAARFPQGTTPLAWRIKPAWASKIHAIYWAASATQAHKLYSNSTSTSVISRAASSAGFNSTDGRITGANPNTSLFEDDIEGGFGGLTEGGNYTAGAVAYGDCANGMSNANGLSSFEYPDTYSAGFHIVWGNAAGWNVAGGDGSYWGGEFADNALGLMSIGYRVDHDDPIADIRAWINGAETSSDKRVVTTNNTGYTAVIGDSTTGPANAENHKLRFGGSNVGTGNTLAEWECCWIGGVLSDADMATITANPADVIEAYSAAGPTITDHPDNIAVTEGQTATFNVTATLSSGGGSLTYQWKKNTVDVSGGTGGTTASYTTPPTTLSDNNASYTCVVTDLNGPVTSGAGILQVNAAVSSSSKRRRMLMLGVG